MVDDVEGIDTELESRLPMILKSLETEASKSSSPGARLESRAMLPNPVATICVRTPLMVLYTGPDAVRGKFGSAAES